MEETRPTVIPMNAKGEPKELKLRLRESTTAQGRYKVALTIDTTDGLIVRDPEGGLHRAPTEEGVELETGPEFRLEMN